jgi:hypothetical protein
MNGKMNGFSKKLAFVLVCLFAAILSGCALAGINNLGENREEMPGMRTDRTNNNAPKVIYSKNVTEFWASFYYDDPYSFSPSGFEDVSLQQQSDGTYLLKLTRYPETAEVDESVAAGLQNIIEKHDLPKLNGHSVQTAGLPPSAGEYFVQVVYDSGEKISSSGNGTDVPLRWDEFVPDMIGYFDEVFASLGIESSSCLSPENTQICELELSWDFFEDNDRVSRFFRTVQEGDQLFLDVYIWPQDQFDLEFEKKIRIDDSDLARLQQIILDYDLIRSRGNQEEESSEVISFSEAGSLSLYVSYASGRSFSVLHEEPNLPENWSDIQADLISFFNELNVKS